MQDTSILLLPVGICFGIDQHMLDIYDPLIVASSHDRMVKGMYVPRIVLLLVLIFSLGAIWHRIAMQQALRVIVENCSRHTKQDIVPDQEERVSGTPLKRSQLQVQIDAVFAKIQSLIPNVTFTHLDKTTSVKHSKVFLENPRERYCVGEDLVVQVDMYDYLNNRKTYGGDFMRPRLFSPELRASVSGQVEDLNNGSYRIHFPLHWAGQAKVSIVFWHPSEGVMALWRARHASLGVLGYQGRYVYLGKEAFSLCGFQMNPVEELCEYKDKLYEEVIYCKKPPNLPCDCLRDMRALDLHVSYLKPKEKPMFQRSRVGVEMAQNLEPIRVTNCHEIPLTPKPKCQPGMSSPFPSGHFFNGTWKPAYCSMTTYKTAADFVKCLQGKKLFLIGDSTLRQFIVHFTEGIQIVKYFRYHETGWDTWQKTIEALNMEKDIYVSFQRHGFPLESFVFFYFMDDMYISRQIDRQAGGKDTILVITMGQHFRQFPLNLFIRRALNIRRAVKRLFLRNPETKVIIKTENTRETNVPPERIGDFHGYTQYLVLREVFQGVNVGFVDAWDMTVASASESVHPSGHTFEGIMSLTFSFACL